MNKEIFSKLKNTGKAVLLDGNWGLEKENLRTTPKGELALTEHPAVFGNKEINPVITNDFSESQIEMITPVKKSLEELYNSILSIHNYVENNLENEFLWPFSMPNRLPDDKIIPIAKFNNKEHEIYRKGLTLRYGKRMQMICGLHYNYSIGEDFFNFLYEKSGSSNQRQFKNKLYFDTGRNILRYRWLLLYLFGASPAADITYKKSIFNHITRIEKILPCCRDSYSEHKKYATSLRMSCIGYRNDIPDEHTVFYNNLESYLENLEYLLTNKNIKYSEKGMYINGEQVQLNSNYLQKINEFYSPIRFKHNKKYTGSATEILKQKGIDYLELRILDLDPFSNAGIALSTLYFIHIFILFCMFKESRSISLSDNNIINRNHYLTALKGRKPDLELFKNSNEKIKLYVWGKSLLEEMTEIGELLDVHSSGKNYTAALNEQFSKLEDPHTLPSAKLISLMDNYNESFIQTGLRLYNKNTKAEKYHEFSDARI